MLRTTSRLLSLSRTLTIPTRPLLLRPQFPMSANMSIVSAKDACPRKSSYRLPLQRGSIPPSALEYYDSNLSKKKQTS